MSNMAEPNNTDTLRETLKTIADEQGYVESRIDIVPVTTEGANYTSALYKAKVSAPNKLDLHLFAKTAIMSKTLREQIDGDRIFETERFFYTELAGKYEHLQERYNVPAEDRLLIPKFYGCNANFLEETVVLEDLVSKGYRMYDRFKSADWDYAARAVEELAKLHALSFSYKHDFPEDFASKYEKLKMRLIKPYEEMKPLWLRMASGAYSVMTDDTRGRLERFMEDFCCEETFLKFYGPGKWAVIIHGDYRASNLMHRVENGKTTSLVPVDYQTVRLGSPVIDLLYFIYSGTDLEFRSGHLERLQDHYYETLAKSLRHLHLDPDSLYSRSDFQQDYQELLPTGLVTAVFLLPIVMVEAADAPKVGDVNSSMETFHVKTNDSFKLRFMDIIDDFIRFGVL